ncbi:MAG TPA: DUF998 domain-containing protein [Propionibacteriaceae bacterium]|nr:DUF998 domain-containing protein [Propionibacteriaceae bacterium]
MLHTASQIELSPGRRTRQRLLLGGGSAILIAFVVTFLVEGAIRPGYSPWRHAVSQLSLGPLGWVNTVAILPTGLALLAVAAGLRGALVTGTGSTWAPRLIGVTGVGFLLAGAFPIAPGLDYPPDTPAQQTVSGLIHGLAITVAFGCLSATCFVMARRFAGEPAERGWSRYSTVSGVLVATGYLATSVLTGLDQAGVLAGAPAGLLQRVTILAGFGWIVLLAHTTVARSRTSSYVDRAAEQRVTRLLLAFGVVAGPFYVVVSLAQAAVRDGFDLTRHDWSLLANGAGGWIQITNLILTGPMVIATAVGWRRAMGTAVGRRWAPRLLVTYGVGMAAAGVFRADPMSGFPAGPPDGPPVAPTLHGTLHFVSAGVGFLALIIATFVMAKRFRREGRPRRAVGSIATGVAFLAGFAGIVSGSASPAIILAFTGAVLLVWVWLSSTSVYLYKH